MVINKLKRESILGMSRQSVIYSAVLHGALLLLFVFGLPSWTSREIDPSNVTIVELVRVSEITNIKPSVRPTRKPAPKPVVKKTEVVKEEKLKTLKVPTPPKAEPKAAEPEIAKPVEEPVIAEEPEEAEVVEVKKEPVKKPEEKTQPKEEVKAEPKKDEPKFEDIFQTLRKDLAATEPPAPKAEADASQKEDSFEDMAKDVFGNQSDNYKEGLPLTMTERDAIRTQIEKHWNVTLLAGAKDLEKIVVTLNIKLAPDGKVISVENADSFASNSDGYYKVAVESAIRAAYEASPLQNLPPEKYNVRDGWSEIELKFYPREML